MKTRTIKAFFKVVDEAIKYNKKANSFNKLFLEKKYEEDRKLNHIAEGEFAINVAKRLNIKYQIQGKENIPDKGPIIVYSNHQGFADIFATLYLFKDFYHIGFVAKREWSNYPILSKAIKNTRSVFIRRNSSRDAVKTVREVCDLTKLGYSFVVYPEGTRSKSHQMADFKTAALKFAQKSQVRILPITIDNTFQLFEETGEFQESTFRIIVHPSVDISSMTREEQIKAFEIIETQIKEGLSYNWEQVAIESN